jgi:hypothetical protein
LIRFGESEQRRSLFSGFVATSKNHHLIKRPGLALNAAAAVAAGPTTGGGGGN